jgi:HEAT repeat protein
MVLNERDASLRELALQQLTKRHNPSDLDLIKSATRDPASGVRGAAIQGFAAFDSTAAQPVALEMLKTDPNSAVRQSAIFVVNPADPAVRALLIDLTSVTQPLGIRAAAASRIRDQSDPAVVAALEAMTAPSQARTIRQIALQNLARRTDKAAAVATATKYLDDPDPLFAVSCVQTIARVGGPAGKATLEQRLKVEHRVTVDDAIREALK